METGKIRKFIVVLAITVLTAGNVWAQEEYDIGEVVVTATKTAEQIEEVGSSVNVITGQEIEETGKKMVADVLRDLPGVNVVQNGALGGFTDVYLRGAQPGSTMVMIDGVEVNDPISPTGSFDFANLTVEDIARIEVIKGPQSTLYGSDAMAGVINIITKRGKGKPVLTGSVEGGSFTTFRESAGVSGGTEKVDYAVSVTRIDSDGISMIKGGSERDGYYNTVLSARAGAQILDNAHLGGVVRYTDAYTDLDDASFIDDPDYHSKWKNFVTRLSWDQQLFDWWDHDLSCGYSHIKRDYRDKPNNVNDYEDMTSWYKGENLQAEWQHNFYIEDIDTVTAGIEYEKQKGSSSYKSSLFDDKFSTKNMEIWGFYAQNLLKLWDRLFTTVGIRLDHNSKFDSNINYRLAASYLFPETDTRLKGSWGTGFKAPTLFQLYSIYGDEDLNPEKSNGFDVGIVQQLFARKVSVGITYFCNNFRHMIDWEPALSRYENIGKTITKGVETEAFFYPIEVLGIGINYTYMEAEDRETDQQLLRRPKNKVGLNINWKFMGKGNLNLSANYVGKRKDMDFITFSRIDLDDYFKVNIYCSYDINDNFTVFGRAENLLDKDYEEVYGFATPGISGYAGARVKL